MSAQPPSTSSRMSSFHPPSTGDQLEPSTPSRIRDSADHAGLSPQLLPLKEPMPSNLDSSSSFPSSSSLTVLTSSTETLDAMEVLSRTPSLTGSPMPPSLSPLTHTLPPEAPARLDQSTPLESLFPLTLTSPQSLSPRLRLLLLSNQSPLPFRPTNWSSNCTAVECSTLLLAEPTSTTLSPSLDTDLMPVRTTSSSETLGEPPGESLAT